METNRKTAIERQMEDVEAKRKSLEWGPFAKLYEDPDGSAYKKRKVTRPGAPMPDERTALLAPTRRPPSWSPTAPPTAPTRSP